MVQSTQVVDHFYQFETLGGFSKSVHLVFNLIWLFCVWGKFGMKEMLRFFVKKSLRYSNRLTKLRYKFSGG